MSEFKGPKILTLDIETAPLLVKVWDIWEQNVGLNQIDKDWFILAFAAKWAHEKGVIYFDQRNAKDVEDDKKLLEKIWKLLDEADIIITQNGKHFDIPKINTRFILNGMKPPSNYKHLDTKQIASRNFAFTSNKLEYLSDKLCEKYKKLSHSKYAGFNLWKACLLGKMDAWKEMERYNKHDVLATEELWTKMRAWDNSINFSLYTDSTEHVCNCGSKEMVLKGFAYTASGKYQRYICKNCGAQTRGKTNLFSKEKSKSLKIKI